ncbi:MAG: substrate-binding domain-containing protein [Spirochaetia bacterium]|jgi:tungstate transport system substrate-binding protein
MKKLIVIALLLCAMLVPLSAQTVRLRLATTTSTEDSGLLPVLNPPFEKLTGITVDVIAVGTGKAIKLGENGDVDVVLVHDRAAEDKFIAQGFGVNRRDVMHNDFIIVGPIEDPAKIAGLKTAAEAFGRIAAASAPFVSRGDKSGTNTKEIDLWAAASVKPKGSWYKEAGQGMGTVLTMSNDLKAYTLSDRGTWIALQGKLPGLKILYEGDASLFNPYGVIAVNPEKHPEANYMAAMQYIAWITSVQGQKVIREYTMKGQQLFTPDAVH